MTEKYQKALDFPVKVDDVSRPRKTVKFQCSLRVLAHAEKVINYLIKPVVSCCFLVIDAKREPETLIKPVEF